MRRWRGAMIMLAAGAAIFGLAWANGHGWEMLWLPAVMLGAGWPRQGRRWSSRAIAPERPVPQA
jgi:hypothetical protein